MVMKRSVMTLRKKGNLIFTGWIFWYFLRYQHIKVISRFTRLLSCYSFNSVPNKRITPAYAKKPSLRMMNIWNILIFSSETTINKRCKRLAQKTRRIASKINGISGLIAISCHTCHSFPSVFFFRKKKRIMVTISKIAKKKKYKHADKAEGKDDGKNS